jgi:hypothetical protein
MDVRAFLLVLCVACGSSPTTTRVVPAPDDVVGVLIDKLQDFPLVALDEGGHGNIAVHQVIERVIRDPRFDADDVVVEWGSAKYQSTIDRFVAGQSVPEAELRLVWQDTTQVLVWESPIYEQFFRMVRDVNAKRAPEHRLRVVLADPPLDWSTVETWTDWARVKRDAYAARTIEREVLAKHRKALLVFGAMHLARRDTAMLADELEHDHPGTLFTIYTTPDEQQPAMCEGGEQCPELTLTLRREDTFDARLTTGAEATYAEPAPSVFADEAYYNEVVRRSHILHDAGLDEIQRLRARYLETCGRNNC